VSRNEQNNELLNLQNPREIEFLEKFQRAKNTLTNDPKKILMDASTNYPFSVDEIDYFKDVLILGGHKWRVHSRPAPITSPIDRLLRFQSENKIGWSYSNPYGLSINKQLPWSVDLIKRFSDRWDWKILTEFEPIEWNDEVISELHEYLDWSTISLKKTIHWSYEFIDKYKKQIDWSTLSANPSLNLNIEFIKSFEKYWDWELLCVNSAIKTVNLMELLEYISTVPKKRKGDDKEDNDGNEDYESDADKKEILLSTCLKSLCCNPEITLSLELLAKYENQIDWEFLLENENSDWSLEKLHRFRDFRGSIKKSSNEEENDFTNVLLRNLELMIPKDSFMAQPQKDYINWDYFSANLFNQNKLDENLTYIIDNYEEELNWEILSTTLYRTAEILSEKVFQFWQDIKEKIIYSKIVDNLHKVAYYDVRNVYLYFEKDNDICDQQSENQANLKCFIFYLISCPEKFDWKEICKSDFISACSETYYFPYFLREYKDFIYWDHVCENISVQWKEEVIEEFADYIKWEYLSENFEIRYSSSLLVKFKDKWFPQYKNLNASEICSLINAKLEKYESQRERGNFFWGLSINSYFPWSEEILEKLKDKLNWYWLSQNPSLPWSVNLIKRFESHWNLPLLQENITASKFLSEINNPIDINSQSTYVFEV
jgi:hypothetical protein